MIINNWNEIKQPTHVPVSLATWELELSAVSVFAAGVKELTSKCNSDTNPESVPSNSSSVASFARVAAAAAALHKKATTSDSKNKVHIITAELKARSFRCTPLYRCPWQPKPRYYRAPRTLAQTAVHRRSPGAHRHILAHTFKPTALSWKHQKFCSGFVVL